MSSACPVLVSKLNILSSIVATTFPTAPSRYNESILTSFDSVDEYATRLEECIPIIKAYCLGYQTTANLHQNRPLFQVVNFGRIIDFDVVQQNR